MRKYRRERLTVEKDFAVSQESLSGGKVQVILTVPDPDAMLARAVAAGAQEVFAVVEEYGWRLGRVVDPFVHHWEIGHPLAS